MADIDIYETLVISSGVFMQTEDGQICFLIDPNVAEMSEVVAAKINIAAEKICETINVLPEQWRHSAFEKILQKIALNKKSRLN